MTHVGEECAVGLVGLVRHFRRPLQSSSAVHDLAVEIPIQVDKTLVALGQFTYAIDAEAE